LKKKHPFRADDWRTTIEKIKKITYIAPEVVSKEVKELIKACLKPYSKRITIEELRKKIAEISRKLIQKKKTQVFPSALEQIIVLKPRKIIEKPIIKISITEPIFKRVRRIIEELKRINKLNETDIKKIAEMAKGDTKGTKVSLSLLQRKGDIIVWNEKVFENYDAILNYALKITRKFLKSKVNEIDFPETLNKIAEYISEISQRLPSVIKNKYIEAVVDDIIDIVKAFITQRIGLISNNEEELVNIINNVMHVAQCFSSEIRSKYTKLIIEYIAKMIYDTFLSKVPYISISGISPKILRILFEIIQRLQEKNWSVLIKPTIMYISGFCSGFGVGSVIQHYGLPKHITLIQKTYVNDIKNDLRGIEITIEELAIAYNLDTKVATLLQQEIRTILKGMEVFRGKHDSYVHSACFSPDGRYIVSASRDYTVRVWDWRNGREVFRGEHNDYVYSACFSPDGRYIVSASRDYTVRVWDWRNGREVFRGKHDGYVHSACFSPDGRYIVSASSYYALRIWKMIFIVG